MKDFSYQARHLIILLSFAAITACVSKKEFREYQRQVDQRFAAMAEDTDNDGVPDIYDKDNDTPKGAVVDGAGIALDVDRDGVPDYKDLEPFTALGAPVDTLGRAYDSDGDGVPDFMDDESNTPKRIPVDARGRSILSSGSR